MESRLATYATTTPVETFTPPILAMLYDINQEICLRTLQRLQVPHLWLVFIVSH